MAPVWMYLAVFEACYAGGIALGVALGTIVHEFGHALAGWAVGLPPRMISLGRGPILVRLRLGGAWLVLRALPVTGYVHALPSPGATAGQRICMVAGGPLASLAMVALAAAGVLAPLPELGHQLALGGLLSQAFILASTIVPVERKLKGRTSVTDALRAYRIARGDPAGSFAALRAILLRRYLPEGAEPPPSSPYLAEILYHRTRPDLLHDAWAQDEVSARLRAILAQGRLPDAERALAIDLVALSEAKQRLRLAKANLAAMQRQA